MKRFIRYGAVPAGIFLVLLIVTVILAPLLVNVQKYIPEIEKQISEATGRSFTLGPDLNVAFFPWLSISFSDMKLGNPPGFISSEFVKIRTFEARIKVLPLLRKKIQISRFVVGGLSVNLEKNDSGRVNWDFVKEGTGGGVSKTLTSLTIGDLSEHFSFALFAVTDGQIKWIDRKRNIQYRVEDIMLILNDFSRDTPVSFDCKATFNDKPVAMEGKVGALAENGGRDALPVEVAFNVVNKLRGQVRGTITRQETAANFQLFLQVAPFSLRDFYSACDLPFPLLTNDTETFKTVSLELMAQGGREKVTIENGTARLDNTRLTFSLEAQNLKHPEINFSLNLDRVDFDRYLPTPASSGKLVHKDSKPGEHGAAERKTGRDFTVTGVMKLGELKIHGGTMTELSLPLQGKEGVFTVAPATFAAYQGRVEAGLTLDLNGSEPIVQATLKAQELEAEPLLRAFIGSDSLRGTLAAELALEFAGDTIENMRKTLNGEANLWVQDGALIGVDVTRLAGSPEKSTTVASSKGAEEKPLTDFAEAKSVVTVKNGMFQFRETSLNAPSHWLGLSGTADAVEQQLDLQVETGFVTTITGKGGREEKVERSSQCTIGGTFAEPELKDCQMAHPGRTNVKHLVAQKLPSPVEDDVKNLVGKDLVDPAIVAQRFRLQPEMLRRSEEKKKIPVGTGKVNIGALREEPALF